MTIFSVKYAICMLRALHTFHHAKCQLKQAWYVLCASIKTKNIFFCALVKGGANVNIVTAVKFF
jgi:hypothetical protein